MRDTRSMSQRRWVCLRLVIVTLMVALGGCSSADSPSRAQEEPVTKPVDDLTDRDGKVCPEELPQGEDPRGHGFGSEEPAAAAPTLPPIEAAWICQYDPTEDGPAADGNGVHLAWVLDGDVRRVPPPQLPRLTKLLTRLQPAAADRMCTADLGPRLMLVYAHEKDLTGVLIDDFGCRDVRLTDDPFASPPGEPTAPGIVPGVFTGPRGLLDALRDAHTSGVVVAG